MVHRYSVVVVSILLCVAAASRSIAAVLERGPVRVSVATAAPTQVQAPVTPPPTVPIDQPPLCPNGTVSVEKVKDMIREEAEKQGADAKLALAVAGRESQFGQNNNSDAGARGPMQMIASTASQYGISDICDPGQNIRGGIAFLKDLNKEFGGNVFLMLAAYNAGQQRIYKAHGIPAIPQTVDYVAKVANDYYGYANSLQGGKTPVASAPATGFDETSTGLAILPINGPKSSPSNQWIGGSVLYVDGDGQ